MEDLTKKKVTELKQALKERGLTISGTKPELIKRLSEALGVTTDTADPGLEDSLQVIDEILNDEPTSKKPCEVPPVEQEEEPAIPTISADGDSKAADTQEHNVPTDESEKTKAAKPTEVSKLTEAERLKIRAEKYGIVSADAKKELRAQRFGLPTGNSGITKTGVVDVDVLKKRAERFGTVVSLSKVDEAEKKRKRMERFGKSTVVSTKTSNGLASPEDEVKKRKRAERFSLVT